MAIWGDDKKTKEMTEAIVEGISATIADSVARTMQPVFTELVGEIRNALGESRAQQDKAAADMAESIRGMKALMEGVAGNMAAMQKVADGQQAVLAKLSEVQRAQAETQKSLTQECETAFAGVRDTQNKLASLYDDIGSGATALVAREEGVVKNQKKILDTMSEDLLGLQAKWTENFNKANSSLTANYDKMFKEMDSTIAALTKYSDALSSASGSLGAGYDQFAAKLNDSLTGFGKGLDETLAKLNGNTEAALAKLGSNTEATLAKFSSNTEATLTKLSNDVNVTMTTYNTGLTAGFDGFTGKMEATVADTFSAIDKQLGSAVETLGKTTEEINDAVARIPKALRGLN